MWCEVEFVRMIDIESNGKVNPPAIQKLCKMQWFEFERDCEESIRKFLNTNQMPESYYLAVGEDDSGFPIVKAVCNYRDGATHFFRPGEEWQKKYKAAMDVPEMEMRCYTRVINKTPLDKFTEGKEKCSNADI